MSFKIVQSWPTRMLYCNTWHIRARKISFLPKLTVALCKILLGLGKSHHNGWEGWKLTKYWWTGIFCFVFLVLSQASAHWTKHKYPFSTSTLNQLWQTLSTDGPKPAFQLVQCTSQMLGWKTASERSTWWKSVRDLFSLKTNKQKALHWTGNKGRSLYELR